MIRATFLLTGRLTLPVVAQASRVPVDPPVAALPQDDKPDAPGADRVSDDV
ncbi:hypothetical protein [Primorskyibacter marinus]|uniref:hypothetical protein n=1 Tax=Primorskyibacter marinus TaxID=1977320 RepID=UPI001300A6DC|nr:hypothetical protein [Primorskyibacter marinus]